MTANWVYETITGGVATCVDSGVAVAASTWYWAHLKSVAGAVSMRIGTAPSAMTQSTVAVGNSTATGQGPVFQVLTHTTATKKLLVDKYAAQITGLTR